MPNITKMSAKRVDMLTSSMDAQTRDTDEVSMKRHIKGVKEFINNVEDFDEKKIEEYMNEYCQEDDNFNEVEVVEKPKRTLSEEQKQKMKDGRKKAKEAREALKNDKKDNESVGTAESEEVAEPVVKPKKARAKKAAA